MERLTRSILRNKIAGPIKRKAVKGYLVHRSEPQSTAATEALLWKGVLCQPCAMRLSGVYPERLSYKDYLTFLCHFQPGLDVACLQTDPSLDVAGLQRC